MHQGAAAVLSSNPPLRALGKTGCGYTGVSAHPLDLLFSCSLPPLCLPRLLMSLLDNWIVFTCPICVYNILHNGILIHKRDGSKANNNNNTHTKNPSMVSRLVEVNIWETHASVSTERLGIVWSSMMPWANTGSLSSPWRWFLPSLALI